MSENQTQPIEFSPILVEIQEQLRESQKKKKAEIEKKLRDKINKEQEAAQKKLEKIDQEVTEEEKILNSYQDLLTNIKADKIRVIGQVEQLRSIAAEVQCEIETIILKALDKIHPAKDLNLQLKELNGAEAEKIRSMKKELEEKFGIVVSMPEEGHDEDAGKEVEDAIQRLNDVVKLLGARKTEEKMLAAETKKRETKEKEEKEDENLPAVPQVEKEDKFIDSPVSALMEILENYRRYEGSKNEEHASYFENGVKKVIDGEYFLTEVTRIIEEAEKFYNKHFDFESPREQLFVKQKMINYQDDARKLMLNVKRICDKNSCSFPKFTHDIMNPNVFKDFFHRVTMENWSNDRDFSIFVDSVKSLRDNYLERLTPPYEYLRSLIQELEIKA